MTAIMVCLNPFFNTSTRGLRKNKRGWGTLLPLGCRETDIPIHCYYHKYLLQGQQLSDIISKLDIVCDSPTPLLGTYVENNKGCTQKL